MIALMRVAAPAGSALHRTILVGRDAGPGSEQVGAQAPEEAARLVDGSMACARESESEPRPGSENEHGKGACAASAHPPLCF